MVAHAGGTAGGMAGFKGRTYEEASDMVQSVVKVTKEINPDIICLAHGGPFSTPGDTKYLYEHTGVAGFVGASSIERIPVEMAIKGVLEEFKSIPIK
jgi:predicted TIM-barrel enzyme